MQTAICCVSCSPMRADATHQSEMVSQLIFGECCELIETESGWSKIKCNYDGYEGWCQESHIVEVESSLCDPDKKKLTEAWITEIEYNGSPLMAPMGSSLTGIQKGRVNWGRNRIVYSGKSWNPAKTKKNKKTIRQLAHAFINTPYLWGGKTVFGADCSGYTQTIFRFLNIHLLRDAWQQGTQGELVNSLKESSCGDLAFFDNAEGRITHVGILMNRNEIIHASGKVRLDKIDDQGIVNLENGKRTHHLKMIRRYFLE